MQILLFEGKRLGVSRYGDLQNRRRAAAQGSRQEASTVVCSHLVLTLYAAGLPVPSVGIRVNARLGFLSARTAPAQTKPGGCIVFPVPVSCSGQFRGGAGAWGSVERALDFVSCLLPVRCFIWGQSHLICESICTRLSGTECEKLFPAQ